MICLNCKKQIPDNSAKCPHCKTEVFHKEQLTKEISLRRWQRWFFYAFIILIFSGMVGVIIKINDANSKALVKMADISENLKISQEELGEEIARREELERAKQILEDERSKITGNLTKKEKEIEEKIKAVEKDIEDKIWAENILSEIKDAIKKLSNTNGTTLLKNELDKIPLADIDTPGADTDEDGLSDKLEEALGTDKEKKDSDEDGYSDKDEILKGYNPIGDGDLGIDLEFTKTQIGKIIIQENQNDKLWYIAEDGKKYFLGL